jgi:predicted dinucleotide-utilizing enzyme
MIRLNVAVVGLGNVGTKLLKALATQKSVKIVAVSKFKDDNREGAYFADNAGIKQLALDEIVKIDTRADIIFDVTGEPAVRTRLRKALEAANNQHTVIVPENVSLLVWSILTGGPLPDIRGKKGYASYSADEWPVY